MNSETGEVDTGRPNTRQKRVDGKIVPPGDVVIKPVRVLVIDDNQSVHDDFRKILCSERNTTSTLEMAESAIFGQSRIRTGCHTYEVDSAYQGEQGLARVHHALQEDQPYTMAFVDVRMPPGWDGIEVAPRLWVADPDLAIVLCTAYSDYTWDEIFDRLGSSDRLFIISKPFEPIEILQMAHTLAERGRGLSTT
jgi:CheY-like chemotaxis protein